MGASIGSFINVLIYRIPKHESIVLPRSHCPYCKHIISFYYNIPVISFLILKGKCKYCNNKISVRYFIIENICGLITLFFYILFIN